MRKDIHDHSLAWNLLKVISNGALLASLLLAPNLAQSFTSFLKGGTAYQRRKAQEALKRLRARHYVRFVSKGDDTYIMITEYGRERMRKFSFATMIFPEKPPRWDKKWRIVVFDIPEKKLRHRKIFRDKLEKLGMFALQKSVFVYPYPCGDEIDFLCEFLGIARYVHYIEADSLGNAEGKTRRHFALL